MLGVSAAVAIVLYLIAYIYFAFKNPDELRSESYSIQKLAIEKGFIGDSISGDVNVKNITPTIAEKDPLIPIGDDSQ